MNKLLLASISVVAFASAAVNANEVHVENQFYTLNEMAHNSIDLASIKPVIELTETIQSQVDKAFTDEITIVNKNNLFAKHDKRKTRKTASLRSE
ncbi:hypothetical protein [Alteromonas sp. ASW11-130]|uniref:hypothetical protein n=1 Tax=Alteromonas sp. ASW11-130 TaxID=3015775 RepID=UPI002242634A|nr:hypothetical protein [Alteromonas sp. ASW11-130]MCW8090666.1 hypothetical protein [Alteromonas sp. ASW11-130]